VWLYGGFQEEHTALATYKKVIYKEATEHRKFLAARNRYVAMKTENPLLRLKSKFDSKPKRTQL
jgi:hypothetical protein